MSVDGLWLDNVKDEITRRPLLPSAIRKLERETGLEPATPSLEGSRSTN